MKRVWMLSRWLFVVFAALLAACASPGSDTTISASSATSSLDYSNQSLESTVFLGADVRGVSFANAVLSDADFSDALAAESDFSGAQMNDAIIDRADFRGADFTDADLSNAFFRDTDLTGAVWSNTTCPDGTNSDDNGGTCDGRF